MTTDRYILRFKQQDEAWEIFETFDAPEPAIQKGLDLSKEPMSYGMVHVFDSVEKKIIFDSLGLPKLHDKAKKMFTEKASQRSSRSYDQQRMVVQTDSNFSKGLPMKVIECKVHLEIPDNLTSEQIDRVRDGKGCPAFDEDAIEDILDGFRERLRSKIKDYNGYVVFAYDS